jgi:hypothetical protein
MAYILQVHISGEEPIIIDVDELPDPHSQFLVGVNPRRRGDKSVDYLLDDVTRVIYPWWRINFVQILPTAEEEEVTTFAPD